MIKHPDGENLTKELLSLVSLTANARILDMGAGDGEAVILMRSLGYDATGVDREPCENVIAGDMTKLPFENETFDAVIAEVRQLVEAGYKEINLLGQNVNSYGKDSGFDYDFADLLEKLASVEGDYLIRFM